MLSFTREFCYQYTVCCTFACMQGSWLACSLYSRTATSWHSRRPHVFTLRSLVSSESLKGTCPFPLANSKTTFPSVNRLLLMSLASACWSFDNAARAPSEPVDW
eukprot:GHUV01041918.1.p1 GENE.GHUV01041918.1~~GHUV01041918.1.p1  ORF type:complete len:104 (-),score=10.43 GHUV01041918.1:274-585(-)